MARNVVCVYDSFASRRIHGKSKILFFFFSLKAYLDDEYPRVMSESRVRINTLTFFFVPINLSIHPFLFVFVFAFFPQRGTIFHSETKKTIE